MNQFKEGRSAATIFASKDIIWMNCDIHMTLDQRASTASTLKKSNSPILFGVLIVSFVFIFQSMPTFILFGNGVKVADMAGADAVKLRKLIDNKL
jgi:hypothetical protein